MIKVKGSILTAKEEAGFIAWINTLYSGIYRKGQHYLQSYNGFCCLGVACMVVIPENQLKIQHSRLRGDMPTSQNSPPWLKKINADFKRKTGLSLVHLNDSTKTTHAEIADLLYAVYVLKVLE